MYIHVYVYIYTHIYIYIYICIHNVTLNVMDLLTYVGDLYMMFTDLDGFK